MDHFIELMRLSFLAAMPQAFAYSYFVFSFYDREPEQLVKRLVILSVLHSLYTDTMQLVLPLELHLVNSIIAQFILVFILFRELKFKQKLFTIIAFFCFAIIIDLTTLIIAQYILKIPNRDDWFGDRFFEILPIIYAQILVILPISWFIRKRKSLSIKRYFSTIMAGDKSSLTKIVILIAFQFILLSSLQLVQYSYEYQNGISSAIILYLVIVVSLVMLGLIVRLLVRTREEAVKSTQDVYVEDIKDMFTSIRGQRHDFLNHMQVIHTMIEMGRTEQLRTYVGDLVKETRQVSDIVNHASPALAAFVQTKIIVAEGKGIGFTYDMPEGWDVPEFAVKTIDIIKILGNLVDNAFDETSKLPLGQRLVHASVKTEGNFLRLEVFNQGGVLDAKERERILLSGYTTKSEGHSGLGLAIVLERVKHYNGKFEIISDLSIKGTSFMITIPYGQAVAV